MSIAPVVTPLVLSTGHKGLPAQIVVQTSALLPFIQVCRQQLSLQALLRVWGELELRTIALTVVQQLGVNQLIHLTSLGFGLANVLTQPSLSSSSNLHPVPRLLNQLPLKQESGA